MAVPRGAPPPRCTRRPAVPDSRRPTRQGQELLQHLGAPSWFTVWGQFGGHGGSAEWLAGHNAS